MHDPMRWEILQYEIPARSEVRLNCTCLIIKYYLEVGRVVEAQELHGALESHEGEEVGACRNPSEVKQGAGGP